MGKYESVVILKDNLKENEMKDIVKKIQNVITDNQGEIISVEEMGIKKLAYEIKKFKQAYYILINFKAESECVVELERFYRIKDEILKFITVKKDD